MYYLHRRQGFSYNNIHSWTSMYRIMLNFIIWSRCYVIFLQMISHLVFCISIYIIVYPQCFCIFITA